MGSRFGSCLHETVHLNSFAMEGKGGEGKGGRGREGKGRDVFVSTIYSCFAPIVITLMMWRSTLPPNNIHPSPHDNQFSISFFYLRFGILSLQKMTGSTAAPSSSSMKLATGNEVRQKFIDFFTRRLAYLCALC